MNKAAFDITTVTRTEPGSDQPRGWAAANQPQPHGAAGGLLSPEAFARLLGIRRRTFQTWRAAGRLPPPDLCIGKTLRWRRETIDAWIDQQRSAHQHQRQLN